MFKCPSCENEFEKTKPGGICPVCRAKLKRQGDEYVLRDRNPEDDIKSEYELIYWDGLVRLEQKINHKEQYRMTFYNLLSTAWIRCPDCKAKLFQNTNVTGALDIKCKRCKSIITYIFR